MSTHLPQAGCLWIYEPIAGWSPGIGDEYTVLARYGDSEHVVPATWERAPGGMCHWYSDEEPIDVLAVQLPAADVRAYGIRTAQPSEDD